MQSGGELAETMERGDSDDEIAELRIQALLTKRENEAEISQEQKPNFTQQYKPMQNRYHAPYSNQRGNAFGHRSYNHQYNAYKPSPYHPDYAGKTVNTSNIVVLTSSDNDSNFHPPTFNPALIRNPYAKATTNKLESLPNPKRKEVEPMKLLLPQDKYSASVNVQKDSQDATKSKLSARMKRLQGSDSDSEDSQSDSSDDSSTSSSSTDSTSSSDSSSNDSNSNSDRAVSNVGHHTQPVIASQTSKLDSCFSQKEKILVTVGHEKNMAATSGNGVPKRVDVSNVSKSYSMQVPPNHHSSTFIGNHAMVPEASCKSPTSQKLLTSAPKSSGSGVHSLPKRESSNEAREYMKKSDPKSPVEKYAPKGRSSISPPYQKLSKLARIEPSHKASSRSPASRYSTRKRSNSKSPLSIPKSNICRSRSLTRFRQRSSMSPIRYRSRSPNRHTLRSPLRYRSSRSPLLPKRYRSRSPLLRDRFKSRSPVLPKRYRSRSPLLRDRYRSRSPILRDRFRSRSPLGPNKYRLRSPLPAKQYRSKSPLSPYSRRSRSPKYAYKVSPYLKARALSPLPTKNYSLKSPPFKKFKSRSPSIGRYTTYSPFNRRSKSPVIRHRSISPFSRKVASKSPVRYISALSPSRGHTFGSNSNYIRSSDSKLYSLPPHQTRMAPESQNLKRDTIEQFSSRSPLKTKSQSRYSEYKETSETTSKISDHVSHYPPRSSPSLQSPKKQRIDSSSPRNYRLPGGNLLPKLKRDNISSDEGYLHSHFNQNITSSRTDKRYINPPRNENLDRVMKSSRSPIRGKVDYHVHESEHKYPYGDEVHYPHIKRSSKAENILPTNYENNRSASMSNRSNTLHAEKNDFAMPHKVMHPYKESGTRIKSPDHVSAHSQRDARHWLSKRRISPHKSIHQAERDQDNKFIVGTTKHSRNPQSAWQGSNRISHDDTNLSTEKGFPRSMKRHHSSSVYPQQSLENKPVRQEHIRSRADRFDENRTRAPKFHADQRPPRTGKDEVNQGRSHKKVDNFKNKPIQSRKLKNSEEKKIPVVKSFSPPAAKRNVSPPAAKRNVSPPAAKRNVSPPAAKISFSPPAATRSFSPPVATRSFSPPVATRSFSPPAAKRSFSPPAAIRNLIGPRTPSYSPERDIQKTWEEVKNQQKDNTPSLSPSPIRSPETDILNNMTEQKMPESPPQNIKQKPSQIHLPENDVLKYITEQKMPKSPPQNIKQKLEECMDSKTGRGYLKSKETPENDFMPSKEVDLRVTISHSSKIDVPVIEERVYEEGELESSPMRYDSSREEEINYEKSEKRSKRQSEFENVERNIRDPESRSTKDRSLYKRRFHDSDKHKRDSKYKDTIDDHSRNARTEQDIPTEPVEKEFSFTKKYSSGSSSKKLQQKKKKKKDREEKSKSHKKKKAKDKEKKKKREKDKEKQKDSKKKKSPKKVKKESKELRVTVGSGLKRIVTSENRDRREKSDRSDWQPVKTVSKLPVHMRLGPAKYERDDSASQRNKTSSDMNHRRFSRKNDRRH